MNEFEKTFNVRATMPLTRLLASSYHSAFCHYVHYCYTCKIFRRIMNTRKRLHVAVSFSCILWRKGLNGAYLFRKTNDDRTMFIRTKRTNVIVTQTVDHFTMRMTVSIATSD